MLHNIETSNQNGCLALHNRAWVEGRLPISWKEALIIPIRKPGKTNSNHIAYLYDQGGNGYRKIDTFHRKERIN